MARSKTDKQMAIDLVLEHTTEVKNAINAEREAAFTKYQNDILASAPVQKLWEKYQTLDAKILAAKETLEKLQREQNETSKQLTKHGASIKISRNYYDDEEDVKLPQLEPLSVARYGCTSPIRKKFDESSYEAKIAQVDEIERSARTAIITSGAAEFGLVLQDVVNKLKALV